MKKQIQQTLSIVAIFLLLPQTFFGSLPVFAETNSNTQTELTITMTENGLPYEEGDIARSPVMIQVAATSPGTQIELSQDRGETWQLFDPAMPFMLNDVGDHVIWFKLQDSIGNDVIEKRQIHITPVPYTSPLSTSMTTSSSAVINFQVSATSNNESDFVTTPNSAGVTIIKYKGTTADVVIPSMIGGQLVTEIGEKAFSAEHVLMGLGGIRLTSVEIPLSVTTIGKFAFEYNRFTSVKIPSNVKTIGINAFYQSQLKKLEIENGVKEIETGAFQNNSLTSIKIPSSVTKIGDASFWGNRLTSVEIGSGITKIEPFVFFHNLIKSVEIPSNVTEIGQGAFGLNDLGTVTFKSKNVKIDRAFEDQKLTAANGDEILGAKTFIEWFEDEMFTMKWTDTKAVPQTMKIYAKWDKYTLSFDSNSGSNVDDQYVSYNSTTTEPVTIRANHTFVGWYKNLNLTNVWDFTKDVVRGNTSLFAKWEPNSYTLSFETKGGSHIADQTIQFEQVATTPVAPTKVGYTFAGWYKDSNLTSVWDFSVDTVMKNTTLYAKWESNNFTLSFETNGGSKVADQTIPFEQLAIVPPASTRAGYTFAGWYKDVAFTQAWDFASDIVTENKKLYAKWDVANYVLSFESNGGSAVTAQSVANQTTAKIPVTPSKTGYTFVGWYKDATLITEWNFTKDVVTESTTLYAKWTLNSTSGGNGGGGGYVPTPGPTPTPNTTPVEPKPEQPTPTPVEPTKPVPKPEEPKQPEKPVEPIPSITFNDISTNWAKDMIEVIAARGIITGYPDGTFRPNEPIKREHVAVMFARAFELTPKRDAVSFSDVPTSHLYYEAITRLQQAGVIDGSNGAFNPSESLTRAQLAKILVLAFGLTPGGTSTFQDVPTTHWSYDYIAALADVGIALGDNGNFRPDEPVTRAQFVAFMYRALNL